MDADYPTKGVNIPRRSTVDALRWAFFALKKDAEAGADGMTWGMYEGGLEGRLAALHDRVHSGAYMAPHVQPSRRFGLPTICSTYARDTLNCRAMAAA